MKNSLFKTLAGLGATLLLAHGTLAAAPSPAPAAARKVPPGLHMIITPGVSLIMDGTRVLSKATRDGITNYHYDKGRLVKARHSSGQVTQYFYADGKLDRIVQSDGTVNTPVYANGTLVMLESSTGKKLGLSSQARGVDKVAVSPRIPAAPAPGVRALRGALANSSPSMLNRTLIAIDRWEAMIGDWNCVIQPEGDTVCIGQPDTPPPGRGDGWDIGGGMPDNPPSGEGGMSNSPSENTGGSPMPDGSDRIPPNLNTQESCIAAAKNTWEIMRDQFCPMVFDQSLCLRQNWHLFLELRQECIATFPLP